MADWRDDLERAREEAQKAREEANRLRQEARELARRLRQEGRDRAREERHRERGEARPFAWGPDLGDGARAEQSFSLEGVRQVLIDQTAGRVTIRPCQEGETPGVVSIGSKSPPRLEVIRDGDRLVIELKLSTGWLFRRKQGATTLVRLAPKIPELRLELGYGEAHIREIEAETIRIDVGAGTVSTAQTVGYLRANVGAGKLAIHGHSGLADCDTGTGDILVDVSGLSAGEYKIDAGIGRAEVRLPEGAQIHFRASSGMGKTRIEYPDAGEGAPTVVRINTGVGEASVRARKPTDAAPPPPAATAKPQRGARAAAPRRREAEELRVLQLLEQGRITSQEAADLIAALQGAGAMPGAEEHDYGAGITIEGEAELLGDQESPGPA